MNLPLPAADLAQRLSGPLAPGRPRAEVSEITLIDGPGVRLRLAVPELVQTWLLTIPVDPLDLDPAVTAEEFVRILRANLAEWWAVKDREPRVAAWGRRLL